MVTLGFNAPGRAKARERDLHQDFIRALAICLVVVIHVTSLIVKSYGEVSLPSWWVATVLDTLSRVAVPFFIMSSGYFLLDPAREESSRHFLVKRLKKILVPLVVWSLVYLAWNGVYRQYHYSPEEIFRAIFEGPAYYHLWYFYTLLGLYIATPILRVYVRGASRNNLIYFVVVWMFATGLVPILTREVAFTPGVHFVVTTQWVGYYVAGALIRQLTLSAKLRRASGIVFLLSAAITVFLAYRILMATGDDETTEFYFDYTKLNIILMSFSGFIGLCSINVSRLLTYRPLRRLVLALSASSMGIYLVHVLVLEFLHYRELLILAAQSSGVVAFAAIMGFTVATLSLSFAITWLLQKLPVVRAIVP